MALRQLRLCQLAGGELDGTTLRWWYTVPPVPQAGKLDHGYTIAVARRGGRIVTK
jgi:hypothetical protein